MRRVLLIRHAECEMNLVVSTRVGGRSNDSPLTPLGVRQSEALGRHLGGCVGRHPRLGPCFTSTAVRARDTLRVALDAARLAGHAWLNTPEGLAVAPAESEQLLELEQGEWQGRLRSEVYTPETLAVIEKDPWNFAPPGGESQRQVEERMHQYLTHSVLPLVDVGGPPAVVVTHGFAIKCFLRGVMNSDAGRTRRIITDNTSVTEVAWDGQHWCIVRINDTAHLCIEHVTCHKVYTVSSVCLVDDAQGRYLLAAQPA